MDPSETDVKITEHRQRHAAGVAQAASHVVWCVAGERRCVQH